MKPAVALESAKSMIQAWYNEYCRTYDKPVVSLEVEEEDEKVSRAYKVTNPENGKSTVIFWSIVSDCKSLGASGIPSDLIASIWDAFNDLG